MNSKLYNLIVYSLIYIIILMNCNCQSISYDLNDTFALAGNNRIMFEKVLNHYKGETKKYKALHNHTSIKYGYYNYSLSSKV